MRENKIKMSSLKQFFLSHQNRIILILELLMVGLFAFIAWQLENRFFAIFIILFFFVAFYFKGRRYFELIIATIIIFTLFNTLTLDSLRILISSDLPSIQHPKAELSKLFTPGSGQEVLPPKVLTMISILKENGIESYRLSDEFSDDVVIYQRIVEGAWPIRLEETSPFVLIAIDERVTYQDCKIIDEKEDVVLVNCR